MRPWGSHKNQFLPQRRSKWCGPRHVCDIKMRNECQSVGQFSSLTFFAHLDDIRTGTGVELENVDESQLAHEQHITENESISADASYSSTQFKVYCVQLTST